MAVRRGTRWILGPVLAFAAVLPFVGKPVHVDDANFLTLARGAAADAWRPHAIDINWQGTTERAFDVLSNPPGIGWWLAPVHDAPVLLQHLWMLPWLLLALFGAARLGQYFLEDEAAGMLLLGSIPIVVLAGSALTPDLPLYACTLAGVGGFLTARRHAWAFALLAGCAALFRYSGVCLIPLLLLAGWQRKRIPHALASALPIGLLVLHDLHAYGQVHVFAMGSFQSVGGGPFQVFRKGVAALAMLGGVGLLPILSARRGGGRFGGLVGAAVGIPAAILSEQSGVGFLMTVLCAIAGGMALFALRWRRPDDRLLACWALGGLLFLLALRFTAARYWLPFVAAPVLAAARFGLGDRLLGAAVGANLVLALTLSWDDMNLADAHLEAAQRVGEGPGTFAGHWGWQYHMEALGWTALEDDGQPLQRHAVALAPWPQQPAEQSCLAEVDRFVIEDHFPGPRVHTAEGFANLHAFVVAGDPPVETYAPWSFSDEPYEVVVVYQRCD
ncbi:MAG TPA: hypothetical protein QGF58_09490 [Myxococcota bacterium]|nr:hypothetical protein [Myxococcota bacterium]